MEIFVWPIATIILVVFFILLFKKPIARLIDRTERVSKHGIQTGSTQEQQNKKAVSKVDEFLKLHDNQLLIEMEERIQTHLNSLHPQDAAEREKFLTRNFFALVITWSFDRTYDMIYGSQINALSYLNDNRNSAITIEHIRPFYNEAVSKFPMFYSNYTLEGWLGFLVSSILLQRNGNDIGITIRGKEFLKYLVEQGRPIHKSG